MRAAHGRWDGVGLTHLHDRALALHAIHRNRIARLVREEDLLGVVRHCSGLRTRHGTHPEGEGAG